MVWKVEELPSRLTVASAVGKRGDKEAIELISKVKERSDDGNLPLFMSDNLDKLSSLDYTKGVFISQAGFTNPALAHATSLGLEVWDGDKLREKLSGG